jgi:dihydrofolate reductase
MRKVTFGGATSLDNFIARPDGAFDWIMFSDETGEIMKNYWANIDTIVMGRKTWDIARANSPKAKKPHGKIKTYVFSRELKAGEQDDGAIVVNDDPGEFVRELKQQEGKEICIMGGGDLGSQLLEARVIDEMGFNIHPLLLGNGVPLFHEMKLQINLELMECRQFKNGCVYVKYRVKN